MRDTQHRATAAGGFTCTCGETVPRRASLEWIQGHVAAKHSESSDSLALVFELRSLVRTGRLTVDEAMTIVRENMTRTDEEALRFIESLREILEQ